MQAPTRFLLFQGVNLGNLSLLYDFIIHTRMPDKCVYTGEALSIPHLFSPRQMRRGGTKGGGRERGKREERERKEGKRGDRRERKEGEKEGGGGRRKRLP